MHCRIWLSGYTKLKWYTKKKMTRIRKGKKEIKYSIKKILLHYTVTILRHYSYMLFAKKRFYKYRRVARFWIFSSVKEDFHLCGSYPWSRNLSTFINLLLDWGIFPRMWIFFWVKEPFYTCKAFPQAKESYIGTINTSLRVV